MEASSLVVPSSAGIEANGGTIGEALSKLYDDLRKAEVQFSTVSNNNVIILGSSDTPVERLQSVVSTFAEVHPARFFVVVLDDTAADLTATVSAVCHSLGSDQKICSEIIRTTLPAKALGRLPSILRAHLVSGRVTEVFIADDGAANRLFSTISPAADRVFFDSQFFRRGLETVNVVIEQFSKVTDFEWLRLSPWREALSQAFERGIVLSALPKLSEVKLSFQSASSSDPIPVPTMLFVSWFISRLKLEVMSFSEDALHTRTPTGRIIPFIFDRNVTGTSSCLEDLELRFDDNATFSKLRVSKDKGIITEIDLAPPLRLSRPIEDESEESLLKKFYLIGESVANFGTSLSVALRINDTFIERQ